MTVRRFLFLCLAMALPLVTLAELGWGTPGDIAVALLAGWAWFIAGTAAEITADWATVAVAATAMALLAFGLHRFMRWCYSGTARSINANADWPLRWTMAALSVTFLMFCAGLSTIGIAQQIAWLSNSKEAFVASVGTRSGEAMRRSQSRNNIHNIGLACLNYHDVSKTFPPGGTFDESGQPLHSWLTLLLPFLDERSLFERIALNDPWDDPRNTEVYRTRIKVYSNPGVKGDASQGDPLMYASSHYAANGWVVGGQAGLKIADIRDGAATTLLAGEVASRFKPWGDPTNWRDPQLGINKSPNGFGGPFKGGSQFTFADGSARFLSETIAPQVLRALSTPAGGETIPTDAYNR